jgi:hypothetical protein
MAGMDRPVISFLTDFGPESAPAICRGVMLSIARDAPIIDISHTVRKYAIRDGAYLLWSAVPWLPTGVHVVVVDPGVGTARLPIGIRTVRGDILIGPDNGVLMPAAAALGGIVEEARALQNRALMLPRTSSTFHGRDIFAPVAAHLAAGAPLRPLGPGRPVDRARRGGRHHGGVLRRLHEAMGLPAAPGARRGVSESGLAHRAGGSPAFACRPQVRSGRVRDPGSAPASADPGSASAGRGSGSGD